MRKNKVTVAALHAKKERGEKITRVTAYDYPMALLADRVGLDMILVGDSLGMVVLGYENTLPVTMDEMIHHAKAVSRAAKACFLLGDMPFMSFQTSIEDAVRNAGRFLKEGGMDAVKIEGGREVVPSGFSIAALSKGPRSEAVGTSSYSADAEASQPWMPTWLSRGGPYSGLPDDRAKSNRTSTTAWYRRATASTTK